MVWEVYFFREDNGGAVAGFLLGFFLFFLKLEEPLDKGGGIGFSYCAWSFGNWSILRRL